MKRLAIPLSILAVATVAACGAPYYAPAMDERAAPIVPQTTAYHPGFGWVQSVSLTPTMSSASGGTATGASASNSADRLNRLAIRMDNGDIQYIDTDSNELAKGTRVELTPDRMIRKVQ